jgi:sulfite reductase alpha subunit-like flavoprotein
LNRFALLLSFLATGGLLSAEPASKTEMTPDVVARYQDALRRQSETVREVSMDVTMEASIPKLKKQGRLSALRRISDLGKVTYKVLGFSGDNTVKKEVMARYMTAEIESAEKKNDNIGITPENYNFKYKGVHEREGRQVHILELKPKKKRVGLFKGELWLDEATYLPVREAGELVKSPSIFIKKMELVRNYDIRDGIAWLVNLQSRTQTRIVGRADLTITYENFDRQQAGMLDLVRRAPVVDVVRLCPSLNLNPQPLVNLVRQVPSEEAVEQARIR